MTSLLFVYAVFGLILHIVIIYDQDAVCLQQVRCLLDVFHKSFIIVSTHRRRHVASETAFKQDSRNPNPDSLIE